jgi:hypothetical protein
MLRFSPFTKAGHSPRLGRRTALELPLFLSLCALLLVTTAADAMVVQKRDFADLAARAEQIVVGTVSDITPSQDESGAPLTLVTFTNLTVLKGNVPDPFTLELSGGPSSSGLNLQIPGMPAFSVGEEAVLFVAGNGENVCPLVGVWQGLFRVRFDPERGTDVVESHDNVPVVGLQGRKLRLKRSPDTTAAPAVTLKEFKELIRAELAAPAK